MNKFGIAKVIVIPYRAFKERIKSTKSYEKNYKIENMDGYLYMVRREF